MDSPSAQLIGDPPSSPFVSEIGAQSRMASKQWDVPMNETHEDEQTEDIFMTPYKPTFDAIEDKENLPQSDEHINHNNRKNFPSSPNAPVQESARLANGTTVEEQVNSDRDLNEMLPLPSTRKTPRSSPRKFAQKVASTPSTAHRGSSTQVLDTSHGEVGSTPQSTREPRTPPQEHTSVDDTCFSAFSEIPDMTLFAKLGQSTAKRGDALRTPGSRMDATPRTSRKRSSPSRSPSPTPRRMKTPAYAANNHHHNDNTTSFLIDFTQQMENLSSYRSASPNKSSSSSSHPNLLNYLNSQRSPAKSARQSLATPAKTSSSIMNLLDFELPPAPTPRSIPTITVRELESLKSSYLSQISSLKATLSGREAEVESLKRAIGDAERRAGEAQEGLREETCRRENIEEEKTQWERRGQELENVLKNVKEEVIKGEGEKEELLRQLEESERRGEEAEERASRAEERYAEALAARASEGGGVPDAEEQVQALVAAQIDAKIEAVSRELHAVYKDKHERKVATLKKSYEARGEKRCAELQARVAELEKQNEDLQAAKDAAFSGPVPDTSMVVVASEAELKVQLEEQKAHLARLENEMQTSRQQQEQLMRELQQERIEKGDLVAAVDEMLALQSEPGPAQNAAASVVEDFRKSISRPTSLRAPSGAGESKIGRGVPSGLNKSIPAPGKSKMLANIERMGRTASGNGAE